MNPYYTPSGLDWFWPVGLFALMFFVVVMFCLRLLFWGGRYGRHRGWYDHDHHDHHDHKDNGDPLAAAKLRYAKGDITKAEFETIKKDLKD